MEWAVWGLRGTWVPEARDGAARCLQGVRGELSCAASAGHPEICAVPMGRPASLSMGLSCVGRSGPRPSGAWRGWDVGQGARGAPSARGAKVRGTPRLRGGSAGGGGAGTHGLRCGGWAPAPRPGCWGVQTGTTGWRSGATAPVTARVDRAPGAAGSVTGGASRRCLLSGPAQTQLCSALGSSSPKPRRWQRLCWDAAATTSPTGSAELWHRPNGFCAAARRQIPVR